jgi:hypothetical protein
MNELISTLPEAIDDAYLLGAYAAKRLRGIGIRENEIYAASTADLRSNSSVSVVTLNVYTDVMRAAYLAGYYDIVEPVARYVEPLLPPKINVDELEAFHANQVRQNETVKERDARVKRNNVTSDVVTLAERRELVRNEVTLSGKRAIVCGVSNDYATVAQIPNGESYSYSWNAVKRVIENVVKFKT